MLFGVKEKKELIHDIQIFWDGKQNYVFQCLGVHSKQKFCVVFSWETLSSPAKKYFWQVHHWWWGECSLQTVIKKHFTFKEYYVCVYITRYKCFTKFYYIIPLISTVNIVWNLIRSRNRVAEIQSDDFRTTGLRCPDIKVWGERVERVCCSGLHV